MVTATAGNEIFIAGGYDGQTCLGDAYILKLGQKVLTKVFENEDFRFSAENNAQTIAI